MSLDLPQQLIGFRARDDDYARSTAAFDAVFQNENALDSPFRDDITKRTLLYQIHYALERDEYEVLSRAAAVVSEPEYYIRYLITERPTLLLPFGQFDLYEMLAYELPFFESVVYSPSGRWGVLISEEGHACVGGPEGFISALREGFLEAGRPIDEQVEMFVSDFAHEEEAENWFEPLLVHIFGSAKARALIAETRDDRGGH